MCCGEAHRSSLLLRTNPDSPRATNQREGIVAYQLRGSVELKEDRIVGVGTNIAEFISHTQHDTARMLRRPGVRGAEERAGTPGNAVAAKKVLLVFRKSRLSIEF